MLCSIPPQKEIQPSRSYSGIGVEVRSNFQNKYERISVGLFSLVLTTQPLLDLAGRLEEDESFCMLFYYERLDQMLPGSWHNLPCM